METGEPCMRRISGVGLTLSDLVNLAVFPTSYLPMKDPVHVKKSAMCRA